jgi:RNA polymerase sigma factor (sigma-70 family)
MKSIPQHNLQQECNEFIIDADFYESIGKTVRYHLKHKLSAYVSDADIEDTLQSVLIHIWLKRGMYDHDRGASFKTWAITIARNYTIQLSKKLLKQSMMIKSLCDYDTISKGQEAMDYILNNIVGRNSSVEWINDNLGVKSEIYNADYQFNMRHDEECQNKRFEYLKDYLSSKLNRNEQLLLQMMKEDKTKEEMMEFFKKSSGNIDTCKSRLRAKISKWMRDIDYFGNL